MNTHHTIALIALSAAFALTACGNKGPLVLPDEEVSEAVVDDIGQADADATPVPDNEGPPVEIEATQDEPEDEAPPADMDPTGDDNG